MNVFQHVKSHLSIVDVISQYITIKKAGIYFKGRCPFHNEKTASFTVSPHIGIYYCFGCHETGDVITFIEKVEQCSAKDAINFLAERYGIDLPTQHQSETPVTDKNHYYRICQAFALWCHQQLYKNAAVCSYLAQRSFTKASIDNFAVGYLDSGPSTIKQLLADMQKKNILAQDLIEANILSQGQNALYSPFESRIIFPIKDHMGRICAFGGRIWRANDTRPKYYNSKESEFFVKGNTLFGLFGAKKTIQDQAKAYLVEGYTDCIAMAQYGYTNTVATLGTACTLGHLKLLARYTDRVALMYDNDPAGRNAILRLTQLCWQANIEVEIISLPEGHDPASFLQEKHDLTKFIAQAQDIFVFFISSLGVNFKEKPLNQKIASIKSLVGIIKQLNDPLKEDILLQKAAQHLELPLSALSSELMRASSTPKAPEPIPDELPAPPESHNLEGQALSRLEKKIFCAIIHNMQLFNKKDLLALIDYLPSGAQQLFLALKEFNHAHDGIFDVALFLEKYSPEQREYLCSIILEEEEIVDEQTFDKLLVQLKKQWWKTISHRIKEAIVQAKHRNETDTVERLLNDFVLLQQKVVRELS